MRRVLREWFRLNREQMGNVDLVMRVQKPFTHPDFDRVQQELQRLLHRLQLETAKTRTVKTDGTAADLAS